MEEVRGSSPQPVTLSSTIQTPNWRWLVSSRGEGRAWSTLSLYLNRRWVALAPTLTVCDLLIMIMGQLASFGLPWWRRAGRQTRGGVTPLR